MSGSHAQKNLRAAKNAVTRFWLCFERELHSKGVALGEGGPQPPDCQGRRPGDSGIPRSDRLPARLPPMPGSGLRNFRLCHFVLERRIEIPSVKVL